MKSDLVTRGAATGVATRLAELPPTKRALLNRWLQQQSRRNGIATPVPRKPDRSSARASFTQQRMWFIDQLAIAKTSNHRPTLIRFSGVLNVEILRQSLREIVRRHDALRTVFVYRDNCVMQVIRSEVRLPWEFIELADLPDSQRTERLDQELHIRANQVFDLENGPLLRAALFHTNAHEYLLAVNLHHIVFDGWSERVLFQELCALYEALLEGRPSPLPDLQLQYGDFADWQHQKYTLERLDPHLSYWTQKLAGVATLQLPFDFARPVVSRYQGSSISTVLPLALVGSLRRLGGQYEATLFMVLLAAFKVLLCRLSGQTDIAVACPVAGRERSEFEALIGCFINLVVMRTEIGEQVSFCDVLASVRAAAMEAYEHQEVPLEKIVERLSIDRHSASAPLVSAMFNLMPVVGRRFELAGLTAESITPPGIDAKFDLNLAVLEGRDDVQLRLAYNEDVFHTESARRILDQYSLLIRQLIADPRQPILAPSLITTACKTIVPDPALPMQAEPFEPLTSSVENWAQKAPHASAIACGQRIWTYGELVRDFHRLAHKLVAQGIQPGDVVGVHGPSSYGFIVGLLAVQRCRAAALPLDRSLPPRRIRLMLDEANARLLILVADPQDQRQVVDLAVRTMQIDAVPSANGAADLESDHGHQLPRVLPDDPAFVFYTSGSTGTPKGVLNWHGAFSQSLAWQRDAFQIGPGDRISQTCALSFEAVVRDIYLPLTNGATLCLTESPDDLTPQRFWLWLSNLRITVLVTVPSRAEIWLSYVPENLSLAELRATFFTGEPLQSILVERWRTTTNCQRIVNIYGPTETTLAKCYWKVEEPLRPGVQPLGSSPPGSQALVVNPGGTLGGIGEFGELVIRTPYRSRGYLNGAPNNARRFVRNPWTNDTNDVIYFTGDMARYRRDGLIEFLGRRDLQVKIRGVRIELGEVESVLATHPDIDRAVAAIRVDPSGNKRLVAYVQPKNQLRPAVTELHDFMRNRVLPAMVPSHFVLIGQLRLTPNGKVDRCALPDPDFAERLQDKPFASPRSSTEEMLVAIWAQLLTMNQIGIHDNFFEIGGHSLLGIQLFAEIERTFGAAPPLASLFQFPTVAELAKLIDDGVDRYNQPCLSTMRQGAEGVPLLAFHNAAGEVAEYRPLVDRFGSDRTVYGVQAPWRDGQPLLFDTIDTRVSYYVDEICSKLPSGPIALLGYCHGGKLAFEAACQLQARGRIVPLVVLIDSRAIGPGQLQPGATLRERLFIDLPRGISYFRHWFREVYGPADRATRREFRRRFGQHINRWRDSGHSKATISEIVFDEAFQLGQYSEKLRKQYYRLTSNNLQAARRYTPKKFAGSILVVRPGCKDHFSRKVPDLGWGEFVEGPIDLLDVGGHHAFLLQENKVEQLLAPLSGALERVDHLHRNVSRAYQQDESLIHGEECLEGTAQ